MRIRQLREKNEILEFLETDWFYAAYAIGDLEPELFAQCEWAGADDHGQLRALALLYKGLNPPALFLMGEPDGLVPVLRLRLRDKCVFLTCQEKHLSAVRILFRNEPPRAMWRMALQQRDFKPMHSAKVRPLSPQHIEELEQFYTRAGVDAFTSSQLATGAFFGVYDQGRIVASAGTHLISPSYGLAAVGNVFTDKLYRHRGYGSATTSAVVAELFRRGIRHVVLNVEQANRPAIRIYEQLGFSKNQPFWEMLASRKQS